MKIGLYLDSENCKISVTEETRLQKFFKGIIIRKVAVANWQKLLDLSLQLKKRNYTLIFSQNGKNSADDSLLEQISWDSYLLNIIIVATNDKGLIKEAFKLQSSKIRVCWFKTLEKKLLSMSKNNNLVPLLTIPSN